MVRNELCLLALLNVWAQVHYINECNYNLDTFRLRNIIFFIKKTTIYD